MCSETFLELECFLWRIAELRLSRNQYSACRFFLNRFLLSFFLLDTSYFLTRVTREHPAWDSWHSVCVTTPGFIRTSFIGEPPRSRISDWEMENRQVGTSISDQFAVMRFIAAIYSITSDFRDTCLLQVLV